MTEPVEEYLLRFLELGVIDVGGVDDKLEKIRSASRELAAELAKLPAKTAVFTTAAADPETPAVDESIVAGMSMLKNKWTTVSNTFSSTPVAIVRAILLEALVLASRKSETIAVGFVNTARNVLPYVQLGDEQKVWLDAVKEIEGRVDERAEQEWTTPERIETPSLDFQAPEPVVSKAQTVEVDRATLETDITRSSGPWFGNSRNQYQMSQVQQWAQAFSTGISQAVADCIEDAVQQVAPEPVDLATPFGTLSKAVTAYVEKLFVSFGDATAGLQRRTNLLWWKEALYSQSLRASYRSLPVFEAAALMALDLHEQVPTYSPASVAAFLEEAILELPDNGAPEKMSLLELLTLSLGSVGLAPLKNAASKLFAEPVGHGPLLAIVGHTGDSSRLDAQTIGRLSGVAAGASLSAPEWGAVLFRELQAARATSAPAPKRSRGKSA
ncbi:MAG: GTPase-associated system all-helical protein GASH [Paraburkholderia sp.]|uniref:GTPase-associated system all-helical protein GASH n=1 Tax=Paraburkholderia sp. TaxID=1926495 RepID=UPI003C53A18D